MCSHQKQERGSTSFLKHFSPLMISATLKKHTDIGYLLDGMVGGQLTLTPKAQQHWLAREDVTFHS